MNIAPFCHFTNYEDRTTSSRHFLSSSRLAQGISPEKVRAGFSFAEGVVRACRRPGFADSLSCGGRTRRDCRGQAGLRVLAFGSYPCSRTIVHVLRVFSPAHPGPRPAITPAVGFPRPAHSCALAELARGGCLFQGQCLYRSIPTDAAGR